MFAPQYAMPANFADRMPAGEFAMAVRTVAGFGILAAGTAVAVAVPDAPAGLGLGDGFGSFRVVTIIASVMGVRG